MYRHTHSALGVAALAGGTLHTGGINLIWTTVLAATITGTTLTATHIALGLGMPHPRNLIAGVRRLLSGDQEIPEPSPAEA